MISFKKIMRQVLSEVMSFRDLLGRSDPARKDRAKHVRTKSLGVKTMDNNEAWTFSYKSEPSWSTTGQRWRGYVRFLKEDVKQAENAEDLNCMVDCTCFSGDVLVLMGDGTYKPIKDIKIGDLVYTHKGRIKKVINTVTKKVTTKDLMYRIRVCGFPHEMIVTGDHPFYTLRGNDFCLCGCQTPIWESVYSHECSSPDLILSRKYAKGHYRGIRGNIPEDNCKGTFKWISVKDLRVNEWFLTPWFESGKLKSDSDFSRLVGYYIAEGCIPSTRGTTVRLTFNINEWNTLGKDVSNICKKLGYKFSLFKSNHGNWFDVRINDKSFKNFCIENVGVGSLTKKISPKIMEFDNDSLKNIFIGSILGDGWIDPLKGMKYVSINFNLISQISTILNKLHIRHTISISNKNNNNKLRHTLFQVVIPRGENAEIVRDWLKPYLREKDLFISSQDDLRSKHHSRSEGYLKSIKLYEKIQYDGLVYDITVEDDESFIANGIAVHNCPDYRFRWAYRNAEADAGALGPGAWNKNNGNPPRYPNTDLGTGMCKHLISLGEYLKTKIDPTAPEPPEEPVSKKPVKPITNPRAYVPPKEKLPIQPKLGVAPEPPKDQKKPVKPITPITPTPYSDTRSGDLLEGKNKLYGEMEKFVKDNPEFEVPYEDEPERS
jgi:intein/homing endonuclease